jgi:hypothetical protein
LRRSGYALLLVVLALASVPSRWVGAAGPESVFVTNFPEVQTIAGSVTVPAPIPQTRLETLEALVSPAPLADPGSYTDAGTLQTAGFGAVTLGVAGTVQGRLVSPAPVGVILLPNVPEILATFRTHGIAQFALRVEALAGPSDSGAFSSEPALLQLGFPSYRVFLYNATPRTSQVTIYAYLKGA